MSTLIKGLIFDFDGLILDTEVPEFEAWREIYDSHGCVIDLVAWADSLGRAWHHFDPYNDLETKVGEPIDRESIRERKHARFHELLGKEELLPGIRSYMDDARRLGLKIGVASSSHREWVVGHLARFGIDTHFDVIKCADDVTHAKPDPELYLAALNTLGVTAKEAIAFEDSPNGTLAAQRAGIFCVAVPNGVTSNFNLEHADIRLESLADMPLDKLLTIIETKNRQGNIEG